MVRLLVASLMLFFCTMGVRTALEAGMLRRLRRREHLAFTHKHLSSKALSLDSQADSIPMSFNGLIHIHAIFVSCFQISQIQSAVHFLKQTSSLHSALLDPPLSPPPKA